MRFDVSLLSNFIFTFHFQKIKKAFQPTEKWGPRELTLNRKYKEFISVSD